MRHVGKLNLTYHGNGVNEAAGVDESKNKKIAHLPQRLAYLFFKFTLFFYLHTHTHTQTRGRKGEVDIAMQRWGRRGAGVNLSWQLVYPGASGVGVEHCN